METNFYTARNVVCSKICRVQQAVRSLTILIFLALSGYLQGYSQTSPLSFTQIPTSSPDLIAPGRGVEQWIGRTWDNGTGGGIMVPAGNKNGLNSYYRFLWGVDIETAQGVYNWSKFDAQINAAIDAGKMFSFGIMPMCTACGVGSVSYPDYLHTLMQGEATNSKDWLNSGGDWVPNWNSPNFLGRYQALLNAIAAHIASGSHAGVKYKDIIYYVDIRGYGDFGEWHTYPWTGTEPTGRVATSATLKALIDMNLAAFPNYPNVIIAGAYDGGNASRTPADVSYYALTKTNTWGQIGWRRDNWGDPGTSVLLDDNSGSYNPGSGSVAFAPLIMNKYKYAPVVGEPNNSTNTFSCGSMYCDLVNEINLYHATSFGNGNFPNTFDAATQANVIAASKATGYRLILTGGNMTSTLTGSGAFNLTLNWQNIGVAPTYENWNVVYELRNSSGGVVWTGNSAFKPKLFLPQGSATATSDNFTLTSVSPGTYSMYLLVKDPSGYKKPLPLAITGRNADGSYLIRGNITVGTGSGNQAPSANAGPDQTIQLPASSVSFSGSGTDPDGTISSYSWAKVSGPTGSAISTPAAASTNITGLIQGGYVFSLTVTDNQGAASSANVQVTVNAAGSGGGSFSINAGPDQTLPAGTATTILTGTIPPSGPPTPTADTINLIVIQGESNAAGNASNSEALPSELASRSSVQIFNHVTNKFENLDVGVNNEQDTYIDATHHGLELGLANEVDAGKLSNPTYLVKIGISGSYVEEWLPNNSSGYQLWDDWMPYVDKAVAQMKALGKPFRIIVWQSLGLNDRYGQGTSPAVFTTKMATIRANFRARYGMPNIRFLSTNFNNPPAQTYDWSYLWDQMAAADPLFISIPVTGATYMDEGTHYDYAGFKLIADNMVNAMISLGAGAGGGTGGGTGGSTYIASWSKVSGPAGSVISTPNSATSNITGLVAGIYDFRLSVTDDKGTKETDDVLVTVGSSVPSNQLPVASAGSDITLTLPANSTNLNGSSSKDQDGSITAYAWTLISGPTQYTIANANSANTVLSNLKAGVYSFQLKVTDNAGATALDTVLVTVNSAVPVNKPPVANAGSDATITLPANIVNLSGSLSADPDGSISIYAWTRISGPSQFSISGAGTANARLTNLVQGVYSFRLQITDNNGATGSDTVKITVNAAPPLNQLPIANAGVGQTIALPVSSVTLDGSGSLDPDGTISSYGWSQASGPSTAVIASPAAASTNISGLQKGTYLFTLKVTDNNGATGLDSVTITVNKAVNKAPNANAGKGKTVTLPTNSVSLDGSLSSDSDGTITNYSWTQVSGPASSTISNGASAAATASNLLAGQYTFQLNVTDNEGATASAQVKISVVAAGAQPPVANAGANQTITLPANSVTLDGSGSSSSIGSIVSYIWNESSGPTVVALSNTVTNTLNNLQAGQYVFYLTVTDNNAATATDSVIITVNAAANQRPVANAGPNISMTLPKNTAALDGSQSSDPDGSITTYFWTRISGPNAPVATGANTANLNLSGLVAGQYIYQLTVTDNDGASSSDQVKIIVALQPNVLPFADAGTDQTIVAPASSVNLDGAASYDPDGSLTAYSWVKVSGPGAITISNSNTATPSVTGLQTGSYSFELTVTDNRGATARDQVTITVNPKPIQPNQLPIANAGSNSTITIPVNSITLNGSSSFDPDGTITGYSWTQISGPSTSGITGGNTVSAAISNLAIGQYVFELTVTDNNGATDKDQVTVNVNPSVPKANQAPVASAGADTTISLPVTAYVLDATGSDDPDGTITSYQWQEMSGPNTVTSSSMDNSKVSIGDLQEGEYTFQVTVTDNNGINASAKVRIIVEAGSGVTDQLLVYPNPAHSVVNGKISSLVTGATKINIYDMNGRLVQSEQVEKSGDVVVKSMTIDGLASGVYTIQVNIGNRKQMIAKFIKN